MDSINLFNKSFIQGIAESILKLLLPTLKNFIEETYLANKEPKDLMRPEEVCNWLGISIPTLDKAVKKGVVKKHQLKGTKGIYYSGPEIKKAILSNPIK
ncbi:hypothetical protein [Rufibacter roseus]|uniref:Helix-turn-helix domain-containing protein n=1 Tax=Rufibacter roseus TaxID=1567108 RepID=A0ABW2DJF6_9BACT|nr:hypothetical protein [Rufibacter roseus]